MHTYADLKKDIPLIEGQIGHTFEKKNLLELAFIHRSFTNENKEKIAIHNERLEFLGDAILGLIVSDFLYSHLPKHPEGELSYLRSRLVEASACTTYLEKMNLGKFLLVGKGEAMNEGKGRGTLLADLFEAIIGAIYLDGGIEAAQTFFFNYFGQEVARIMKKPHRNWKAELQDFCQKKYRKPPEYSTVKEEGPDHLKVFHVQVQLEGRELGKGKGLSKKEAEQAAAAEAMEAFEREKNG